MDHIIQTHLIIKSLADRDGTIASNTITAHIHKTGKWGKEPYSSLYCKCW
jgi:hypothetical protein